jgi:hypothetical protein
MTKLLLLPIFLLFIVSCSSSISDDPVPEIKKPLYVADYDNGDSIFINVKIAIDEKGWKSKTPEYFETELKKQWEQINFRFNNSDKKKQLKRKYRFKPDVDDIVVYSGCSYWGENGANMKVISKMDKTIFKLVVVYDCFYDGAEAGEYGGGCGNDDGIGTILVINASDEMKNKYSDHFGVYTYRAITHELGHFRGLIDLYAEVIEAENNPVTHEKFMPAHCLMNDFCYTPDGESYWSDYAIKVINKVGNQKKADLIDGMMYEEFPDKMIVSVKKDGTPVAATVKLFPAEYDEKKWSSVIREVPFDTWQLTEGSHTVADLRKLFFASESLWDRRRVFLAEATVGTEKKYQWISDYMMHDCGLDGKKTYELNFNF